MAPRPGLGLTDMTIYRQYRQPSAALNRSCMSALQVIPHVPSALGKLSMWPTYLGKGRHAHSEGLSADDLALSAEMPSVG